MLMPKPSQDVIDRRADIVNALRAIVPGDGVITAAEEMRAYETDGLSAYRQVPLVVTLPETPEQVAEIGLLRPCRGQSGAARRRHLAVGRRLLADGVLLGLGKFNRVLDIDYANRCAVVQPGVTNLAITHAVQSEGFYYAPDPSSQIACSIGGNVAENAGGVHCLKYGLTTNNLMGLQLATLDGELLRLGGRHLDSGGYDLMGLLTGSEGLLAWSPR